MATTMVDHCLARSEADIVLTGATSMTAGAPPPVIRTTEGMGAQIINVYGLTETYGKRRRRRPEWYAGRRCAVPGQGAPER